MSSANVTSGLSFSELPKSKASDLERSVAGLAQQPLIDCAEGPPTPAQRMSEEATQAEATPAEATQAEATPAEIIQAEATQTAEITQAIAQLTEGDFHSKWDSAKHFSKQFAQWGDKTIPHLIAALEGTADLENQWFLIRVLSQYDRPEVVVALTRILATTPDEDIQIETSKALTGLGESAIALLTEQLAQHPKPEQRILAARTLAHIRRSEVLEPLLSVTNDANAEIRAIALEALGSFHDPRITPVLLAALNDIPAICIEAVRTLGRRRDLMKTIDLIAPLAGCLTHSSETVAKESAIALGRLGGEQATIALGECVLQPVPTAVKIAAVRALGWMSSEQAVEYLAIAFNCAIPVVMPRVREEIARALGQMHSSELKNEAAHPLINWLKAAEQDSSQHPPSRTPSPTPSPTIDANESPEDNRPNIGPDDSFNDHSLVSLKQSIISALTRLAPSGAIEVLVPLLSDSDPRIQLHTLNALKQIDPRAAQTKIQTYLRGEGLSVRKKTQIVESLKAW